MWDAALLFWGETLESFVSCDNIDVFYSDNHAIQLAGRRN